MGRVGGFYNFCFLKKNCWWQCCFYQQKRCYLMLLTYVLAFKGAVWGLSAQRDSASAKYDVSSVLFDVTMQNLYGKKSTLSLSQRKDTCFFLFLFPFSNKGISLSFISIYRICQNVSYNRHTCRSLFLKLTKNVKRWHKSK
jgi:hypothetical protein